MYMEQVTQRAGIIDYYNTAAINNTTGNSAAYIDMLKFKRAFYVIRADTGANGQWNYQLQSSANTNFNTAHNINGTLSANLNTNNQLATAEVRGDQVTSQNAADRYVRLYLSTNANIQLSAVGFGFDSEQLPGNQYNINSTLLGSQTVANT